MGRLKVRLVRGVDLPAKDISGTSDPYATLSIGNQKQKSNTVKKNLNPNWNQTFTFNAAPTDVLHVSVYDWDRFGKDDLLGSSTATFSDLQQGVEKTVWLQLQAPKGGQKGSIELALTAEDFGAAKPQGGPPPQQQQGGYGGPPPQSHGYPPQQGGYGGPPPQSQGYPSQGGYGGPPPQQGGYPPQSHGYPPQSHGYPPQQGGYGGPPPQQGGYPPQSHGYGGPPPQQGGYPPQQGGYGGPPPSRGPPQQGGYGGPPPQQGGYGGPPPQQGGYGGPPQQGGYGNPPPQQRGAPQQGGAMLGPGGRPIRRPHGITDPEIQNCMVQFRQADADGSGTIDARELKGLLRRSMGNQMSDSLLDRFVNLQMQSLDANRSGSIDFDEFLQLYMKLKSGQGF